MVSETKYYKELYEERAAIMEFDGGLTREKAEERALSEVSDLWAKDTNLSFGEASTYHAIVRFKRELRK